MLFGNKNNFAIEAYHEPIESSCAQVFGRMCLWCNGLMLGDISEPSCMLDVTVNTLNLKRKYFLRVQNDFLKDVSDEEVFEIIDNLIYKGNDVDENVLKNLPDGAYPFDFLTNGGESFDHTKSFIIPEGSYFRILFEILGKNKKHYTKVTRDGFLNAIDEFIDWIELERSKNKV